MPLNLPHARGYGSATLPTNTVLAPLGVYNQFFRLATGEPFTAIECSDFNLFARYLDEGVLAIQPVLQQRQQCGFNLLRVWTLFDIPGIGTLRLEEHADLYDHIPAFTDVCAQFGLRVEFTAYDAARRCRTLPLLEGVNELDQNTNEPDHLGRVFNGLWLDYQQAHGLLASHGSNGSQAQPVQSYWDYLTFHTNGAFEEQRKVGHNAMEWSTRPVLTNETSRSENYPSLASFAFDSAAGAALLCAGSCFHSPNGKKSQLWEGKELDQALQWASGARSVSLVCQEYAYAHRTDLEGAADVLRAYGRGPVTVIIHQ